MTDDTQQTEQQQPEEKPKAERMSKARWLQLLERQDRMELALRHMAAMNGGDTILKKYGIEPMTREEMAKP